ncbi:MAG: lactate dehydrogenase [Ignavibacteriae bacterium]|nr:lactate dehydrogenase [Ignavibacteriota bacterium]
MKVGIIGVGFVGTACAKAMLLRGSCREVVLIDLPKCEQHTRGVCNDLSHGEPLCPATRLTVGGYSDLRDASVVVITAGFNEKKGGATDRKDPWGRQKLLSKSSSLPLGNADVYRDVVPQIVSQSSSVPIVVVTDPPDSLGDVAREEIRKRNAMNPIVSTGTFLDTLRFRIQIAQELGCSARSVDAYVIGEHGKTQVYVWSSVRIGGIPISELIPPKYANAAEFRRVVERAVIDANIDIIDATDASQHGIGIVTTRIVEAILRDERFVAPVGTWHKEFGVTLSLPSVVGKGGVVEVLKRPAPSTEDESKEEVSLQASAAYIAEALQRCRDGSGFDRAPSLIWAEWFPRIKTA